MNKRGQFFILSAVIITAVIATLTSIYNYSIADEEPKSLYDLSENIKNEGFEVVDYALYSDKDQNLTLSRYTNNISDYILNTEPDAEFFFIYGNYSLVRVEDFTKETTAIPSTISIQVGSAAVFTRSTSTGKDYNWKLYYNEYNDANSVNITINSQNYNINLSEGQNFIIVMKKTYKNNTYLNLK